ncbi:hypothetical protein [Gymnodinialimonas sp.]
MRTCTRTAPGAALLYVLSASAALACPTASDLNGAGVRFVGSDGADEVHRRLDAERIEIDYVVDGGTLSRSVLAHGVHLLWYGDIDGAGAVVPDSGATAARAGKLSDLPVPAPGLTWEGSYAFTDATGTIEETGAMSVAEPTPWVLGDCTLTALPVTVVVSDTGGVAYTETMMFVPDLGTAVLVGVTDSGGETAYTYTSVRAEAS